MLDSAHEAQSFLSGCSRNDLDADRMLVLAVLKSVEIIGEAASRVTPEGRAALPNLPWQDMIGMRNRLVHGYFDVDLDVVWQTVTKELPGLVDVLEAVLDE